MGNKINKVHQKLIEKQEQTLTASRSDVGLWTNHKILDLDGTLPQLIQETVQQSGIGSIKVVFLYSTDHERVLLYLARNLTR